MDSVGVSSRERCVFLFLYSLHLPLMLLFLELHMKLFQGGPGLLLSYCSCQVWDSVWRGLCRCSVLLRRPAPHSSPRPVCTGLGGKDCAGGVGRRCGLFWGLTGWPVGVAEGKFLDPCGSGQLPPKICLRFPVSTQASRHVYLFQESGFCELHLRQFHDCCDHFLFPSPRRSDCRDLTSTSHASSGRACWWLPRKPGTRLSPSSCILALLSLSNMNANRLERPCCLLLPTFPPAPPRDKCKPVPHRQSSS